MKIAIVTGTFPSLSESFVLNHVTGLLDEGHDVQVFSNGLPRGRLHPDFDRYGLRERCKTRFPGLPADGWDCPPCFYGYTPGKSPLA